MIEWLWLLESKQSPISAKKALGEAGVRQRKTSQTGFSVLMGVFNHFAGGIYGWERDKPAVQSNMDSLKITSGNRILMYV